MKNIYITLRGILCVLMAILLTMSLFIGLIGISSFKASASSDTSTDKKLDFEFREKVNSALVTYLHSNKHYKLIITTTLDKPRASYENYNNTTYIYTVSDGWSFSAGAKVTATISDSTSFNTLDERLAQLTLVFDGISNPKGYRDLTLSLTLPADSIIPDEYSIFLPESYFTLPTKEKDPADPTVLESKTILESYKVTDSKGNILTTVDEKTPPFNIIVSYLEYGIEEADLNSVPDRSLSVFIEDAGGFISPTGSNRGTLEPLIANTEGIPRFKATFSGLTFKKDGANTLKLKMLYDIDDDRISGALNLTVQQVTVKDKDDDDEKKIAPLKPYIIVDSFSYGEDAVVAGSEFTLKFKYTNTSANIGVENIRMSITPPEDISIASSSSTSHVSSLAPNGSLTHEIKLYAKPTAKVGNAELKIEFTYQYIDEINKTREEVVIPTTIGIPIVQLDRFSVDSLTELPEWTQVGEMFFIGVSFINKGKSTTNNISVSVESKNEFLSSDEHFGNLEAGKSGSTDVGITVNGDGGDFAGDIVIVYEDESSNQKTIRKPFNLYVQPLEDMTNEGMIDQPILPQDDGKVGTSVIITTIIGCLLIAAPLTYFFIKKKTNDGEVLDEDF